MARSCSGFHAARVRYRIAQGLTYLRPRSSVRLNAQLETLLTPNEFDLVRRLSPADRAHHLSLYQQLTRSGCTDKNLLKASLLHDVGKVHDDARAGIVQRTTAVLLTRMSPRLLDWLADPDGARWRRGLYLTRAHPTIGADLARLAGCNERVCWLIEHHHDVIVTDGQLDLLQRADDGCLQ